MASERANLRAAAALFENLAAAGVRDVCISPGSRSAPLALAAAAHPGLRRHVITDERAAAFFALGLARASERPVTLVCTSGTAATNYAPAVAEASLARIPLIVITADRPTELRDSGAAQTIRQSGLFAAHVCWSADTAVPEESWPFERYFAVLACRAVAAARRHGAPVHVNVPFREPLWTEGELSALDRLRAQPQAQPSVRFETCVRRPSEACVAQLASRLGGFARGLIVCGPGTANEEAAGAFVELARTLGWPLLVDALSGLRFGVSRFQGSEHVVADSYDILLRSAAFRTQHRPDAVLRFGTLPTSKALARFLAESDPSCQIAVWPGGMWADPDFVVSEVVDSDPATLVPALAAHLAATSVRLETDRRQSPHTVGREAATVRAAQADRRADDADEEMCGVAPDARWARAWVAARTSARTGVSRALACATEMFEGAVACAVVDALPDGATLFVGNSLPVRALDTFAAATERRIRALANRGANGIDGVTASALGVVSATQAPCVLFTGDLSFLHDIGALQVAHRHGLSLTIVVVNNDGGGIFSFLPKPSSKAVFEELFATPHGLSLSRAVEMCGGSHVTIAALKDLTPAVAKAIRQRGLRVIEVVTERETTLRLHEECVAVALEAVESTMRGDA